MGTKMKRFMLTVPEDLEQKAKELKKEIFFDQSYAEVYRYLIRKGVESLEKKEKQINAR